MSVPREMRPRMSRTPTAHPVSSSLAVRTGLLPGAQHHRPARAEEPKLPADGSEPPGRCAPVAGREPDRRVPPFIHRGEHPCPAVPGDPVFLALEIRQQPPPLSGLEVRNPEAARDPA